MELEYGTTVEQWGNKVLVDHPVSTNGRSLDFADKVSGTDDFPGYVNSVFLTTREVSKAQTWDRKSIKQRNDLIAKEVCMIW